MFLRLSALVLWCSALLSAALLRIEVVERTDVLDGKPFGAAGPYERVVARAYFGVNPDLPANRIITDVAKAPRNEQGMVEFSSDLYILKPRDPAKGNGAVLYEVSNRGGKGMLGMFNRGGGPADAADAGLNYGDGFLLEQGYTLVWLGWQFDPPRKPGLMRLYAPAAAGITGLVRSEIVVDRREESQSLADRNHIAYPVTNPDDPQLRLTVRERNDGPRRTVPRADWRIEGDRISLRGGFEPGRIYELVYPSRDPVLIGLGPAAVRDYISFLKYGGGNGVAFMDNYRRYVKRAYGFGVSQSGRFLRTFLYYGFNADEKGRKVFDGILAHVAGGGRGSFNIRFGQASRDGHPFFNTFYPTDIFPFTDLEETDPETGLADGLLRRAMKDGVVPRIFYTNSSYEYWGRAASLIHTTPDGKGDAAIPETTRIYFFAGGQHGPGTFPPRAGDMQNLPNPNPYTWSMRALLVAMDRWVKDGKEPPPSQYPRVGSDTLTTLGALNFPKIPGVAVPTRPQRAWRVDYGPEFRSAGIVSVEPPKTGKPFPVLVPQVDADGNETCGVRLPEIQVPLATYTGWNLRTAAIGASDEMFSMAGSWIPFPRTREERVRNKDPRPSIEERYPNRAAYLGKFEAAARALAASGYLLEQDVPPLVKRGAEEWDSTTAPGRSSSGQTHQ